MDAEKIASQQIARAAAEGVAIALAARNFPDDLEAGRPIVVGFFPKELYAVTLEQDVASGQFTVKNIEPHQIDR
jgi:hypothetical protein